MTPLLIDSFAGGGGASLGIELALGRSPDIAVNHDAAAITMHKANHPATTHYTEDVWKLSPKRVTKGRPVGLLWASPDCKHFSRAKGSKPVEQKIRSLAWVDEPVMAYFLVTDVGSDPIVADVLGIKLEQSEGVRDPDAELIEKLEIDEQHIRRLAENYLAQREVRP